MNKKTSESKPKALVTGATRGIGKAIAIRLHQDGWDVVGTGRVDSEVRMREEEELAGVRWLDVDFGDQVSFNSFLEKVVALGPFEGLVNNAGINRIKPVNEVNADDYDAVHGVNLRVPYFLSQQLMPGMKSLGGGRIVNVASIWSVVTKAHRSLYSSAKTGLLGQTRALAAEVGKAGILVNAVSPGFVLTDMTRESLTNEEMAELSAQVPLQRMAEPSDLAEVVAFLISRKNRYITGQNIVADGGFTIV